MANSLKLTRNQLAGFLKDFEQIKQFEKLFSLSEDYLNSGMIDAIAVEAGTAAALAFEANAQLVTMQDELDMLALAPAFPEMSVSDQMGRAKLRFVS